MVSDGMTGDRHGEGMFHLAAFPGRTEEDDRRAESPDGAHGDHEFRAVRRHQRHSLAGPHPASLQRRGHPVGELIQTRQALECRSLKTRSAVSWVDIESILS